MSVKAKNWQRTVREARNYTETVCTYNAGLKQTFCEDKIRTRIHNTWVTAGDHTVSPFWPEFKIRPGYYATVEEWYWVTFSDDRLSYTYYCPEEEYSRFHLRQRYEVKANVFRRVLKAN